MNAASILFHDLIVRLKRYVRNPANIVWVIVVPLVIVNIVGFILPNDDGIVAVYVQDKDGGLYSQILVSVLVNEYSATVIDGSLDTQTEIDEIDAKYPGQAKVFIIIPDDFFQYYKKYTTGEEFQAQLTSNNLSFIMDMMKTIDEDYNDGNVHITIRTNTDSSNLGQRALKALNNNLIKQVSPGLTVTLILLIVSSTLVVVIRDERQQRMNDVLRNSRYNKGIQAVSLIIWALLPSAIILVMTFIAMRFILDVSFDSRVIVALFLASTFTVAYGLLVSEIIRNGQAVFAANTSIMLAMLLLCGGIFPKDLLAQRIVDASVYVPVSYIIDIFGCTMGYAGNYDHSVLMASVFIIGMFAVWYVIVKLHERSM